MKPRSINTFSAVRKRLCASLSLLALIGGIQFLNISDCVAQSEAPAAAGVSSATVAFANGGSVTVAAKQTFRTVEIAAGDTATIQLQLAYGSSESPIVIQALDGGTAGQGFVDADGMVSFAFQVGAQQGLYRVYITNGSAAATLRFWVPSLNHPETNPPALTPDSE